MRCEGLIDVLPAIAAIYTPSRSGADNSSREQAYLEVCGRRLADRAHPGVFARSQLASIRVYITLHSFRAAGVERSAS